MERVKSHDVIIIGAGAAGLMCAIEAGKRGRSVVVLERNRNIGEKIRISGGGRCNFTNVSANHEHFISHNSHFSKSALARYTPADIIALVEHHGITYHEKKLGQLFCDHSSGQIITMLQKECAGANVEIIAGCHISDVGKHDRFVVTTDTREFISDSLVIATGGLSIPKLGATDFGYRLANTFGMNITTTKPGLVPLTFGNTTVSFFKDLSGVSTEVIVSCNGASFKENLLFTHHGLSGPAILQVSSYWNPGDTISIDLSPTVALLEFFKEKHQSTIDLKTALSEILPKRLAEHWCKRNDISGRLDQCSFREFTRIAEQLHGWKIIPQDTEGYSKAEVTCGGVDTNELSSKTMESKKTPGLFVIGELVDVTGHLGGYNFHWAWASGFVAGQYA